MTAATLLNGMAVLFSIVLLAAIAAPFYFVLPKWMAGEKVRRVAFHTSAIDAIGTELARPQRDQAQVDRLLARRRDNVAALKSLDPAAVVPPLA